jgi:hypothetical protein
MRVIIKPAGTIALVLAFSAGISLMAYSALKGKKSSTTSTAPSAAAATTGSSAPTGKMVPASYVFSAKSGTSISAADQTAVLGELVNGATYKKASKGYSLGFASRDKQMVDLGKPLVDTTRSFAVSAWVRMNDFSWFQTFVSQDGTVISGFYLQWRNDTKRLSFTLNSEDKAPPANPGETEPVKGYRAESSFVPQTGQWYHIVGVYDQRAHQSRLYVNGKKEQTKTLPSSVQFWSAKGHTLLGAAMWEGKHTDYVNGTVENVRIYPRVLGDKDVEYLFENRL